MDFNEYQAAAMRTAKIHGDALIADLVHASLGLATETGEFTSTVKRMSQYGKTYTNELREHLCEELGDTLWYIALAATALGVTFEGLAEDNIAKLKLRFPEAFSNEAAEARADKGGLSHKES